MSLPATCIKRPVFALMMNLVLILVGLIALIKLPVRELPNIDPPVVSVTTTLLGASAEVMETEVTEVLEESIANISGIKRITSQSREQLSQITVEFELSTNVDVGAQDVRDRVSRVRGRLPDDVEEPIIAKEESDAQPILWVALYSDRLSTTELTTFAENVMKDRLQTVSGVSSVIIGGSKRFAIRLRLDPLKMAARNVTVTDIEEALIRENVELPSGAVENLSRELSVQTRGEMKTPDEFNKMIIRYENDTPVRLQDIGIAEAGVENEKTQARYRSQPAVGLGIVKQSQANTIAVADAVKARVQQAEAILPAGVQYFFAYDESIYVKAAVKEVAETILIAVALVVIIIFIFLRNLRTTLVPSLAIPVSVIGVFALLSLFGFSINILTLLALVLAIGIVVDDAIIVLENIYRHMEDGMEPKAAAIQGMKEVTLAVIATTASLVAVFVPLAFLDNETGRLLREFAIALAGAVLISSFVALTLTPVLCSRFLKKPTKQHGKVYLALEGFFDWLSSIYRRALSVALRHRILVLGSGVVALALGIVCALQLKSEFLPDEDKGRIFTIIIAPEGSTADYTDRYVREIETIVAQQPEVAGYFSAVALGRGVPGQNNQGLIFVRLKEREDRERTVQQIIAGTPGKIPGLGTRFFTEAAGVIAVPIAPKAVGGGRTQPFQLVLQNDNLSELSAYAQRFAQELAKTGMLMNTRSNFELSKQEVRVFFDRERANALGISIRDIARTLQILVGGLDLSDIKRDGKLYDVIAQLNREDRLTPSALEQLYVRSSSGDLVQLSNLVRLEEGIGPNTINHYNRLRSAIIEGTPVAGIPLGEIMQMVEKKLADELPPGFSHAWAGEAENLQDTNTQGILVLLLASAFVYMVLASQFESLIHPITVMTAIPLAAVGAFGLLLLLELLNQTGLTAIPAMTINLFSLIGTVLLVGLVTKNSILLVDFANQAKERGLEAIPAMLEAGEKRLRPILMTAASTIIGILPIAIGLGAGAESRRPLGIVVIGGMITSTFLTLFIVPALYTVLDQLFRKKREIVAEVAPETTVIHN